MGARERADERARARAAARDGAEAAGEDSPATPSSEQTSSPLQLQAPPVIGSSFDLSASLPAAEAPPVIGSSFDLSASLPAAEAGGSAADAARPRLPSTLRAELSVERGSSEVKHVDSPGDRVDFNASSAIGAGKTARERAEERARARAAARGEEYKPPEAEPRRSKDGGMLDLASKGSATSAQRRMSPRSRMLAELAEDEARAAADQAAAPEPDGQRRGSSLLPPAAPASALRRREQPDARRALCVGLDRHEDGTSSLGTGSMGITEITVKLLSRRVTIDPSLRGEAEPEMGATKTEKMFKTMSFGASADVGGSEEGEEDETEAVGDLQQDQHRLQYARSRSTVGSLNARGRKNRAMTVSQVNFGVFSTQNCRHEMEDAHSAYLRMQVVCSTSMMTPVASGFQPCDSSVVSKMSSAAGPKGQTPNRLAVGSCGSLQSHGGYGGDKRNSMLPVQGSLSEQEELPGAPAHGADRLGRGHVESSTSMGSAHELLNDDDFQNFCTFAVYDGHGGQRASEFANETIPDFLCQDMEALKKGPEDTLREAFLDCERKWIEQAEANDWDDGTTAAVVLLDALKGKCTVGNVGDSEVVLVTRLQGEETLDVKVLTEIHAPERNAAERARIVKMGGKLYNGRVGNPDPDVNPRVGAIAVSRSIGDLYMKDPRRTGGRRSGLIAEPYITSLDVAGEKVEEQFLIIACDGLWDVVAYAAAADIVSKEAKDGEDLDDICEHLADLAKQLRSTDNITVMVVQIVDPN